ncbi:hypothetical protein Hanom_Chr00s000001g01593211 [Helianthus anomalus]
MIWMADVQITWINLSHSLPSHNSRISQNFINLLSRRIMNRSVRISPDLGCCVQMVEDGSLAVASGEDG